MFKKTSIIIIYFFFILSVGIAYAQFSYSKDFNKQKSTKVTKDLLKNKKQTFIKNTIEYYADIQDDDLIKKRSYLIGNVSLNYTNIHISADYIEINWNTNMIYARGKLNMLGNIESYATLTQAGKKYEYGSFRLNLKTKKGNGENIRIEEQEGVIISEKVLQKNDNIKLMYNTLYTTDTYFKDKKTQNPDYFFKTRKIKYYNKKAIITGPIFLYIYKTPFPIPLPFSYISLSEKSSPGFVIPRYGEGNDQGFFIEDLGFFWPISDYWHAKILSSFYTTGSWSVHLLTNYKKRYKYSGELQFNYDIRINRIKKLNDYKKTKNFQILWNHIQDKSLYSDLTFSAKVDFLIGKYYEKNLSIDGIDNEKIYNRNSSINLDKIFGNFATMKLKIIDLNQNLNTTEITGDFPSFTLNINRQNPFSWKNKKILRNLYVDYNFLFKNKIKTSEKSLHQTSFKKEMFDNMKTGIRHELKFGSNIIILKYIHLSPKVIYDEIWDLQSIEKRWGWDIKNKKKTEQILINRGFKNFRTFSLGVELNTTIYGFMQFKKNNFFQAIRHKIDPKIIFRYAPDFTKPPWGYYKTYEGENNKKIPYSIFDESSYIDILNNSSGRKIGFYLNNNLEIKVKDKSKDEGVRKIVLFEQIKLSTHYNLDKKLFKWSDINFSGNTPFTKNVSIRFSGKINPYKVIIDKENPSKEFKVDKIGSFIIHNFDLNFNYTINNETFQKKNFEKKEDIYKKKGEIRYENFFFDKDNYAHYFLPWQLNTSMNYNYNRSYMGNGHHTHNAELQFNGKLSPTPYWEITFNGYYNLITRKVTRLNLKFERDLRSFLMNFNWTPISSDFGSTWNFFIGIKTNALKNFRFYKKDSFPKEVNDF